MSDLPRSVGITHRAALRNHLKKNPVRISGEKPVESSSKQGKKKDGKDRKSDQGLKQTDIIAFNQGAEGEFVKMLQEIIKADGPISIREAIREAAYELNVSTETAKRYLEKHTARRAEFNVSDGYVRLREK